ncbi:MAG: hypothetical protein M8866_07400 [marine benthic group bacterium]|jgi:hypothetical protein|nr:hypothetical protein [Candidatus Benthicola marisminoris]
MKRLLSVTAGSILLMAVFAVPAFAQDAAPITPHEIEGKEACSMCHSGAMEGMPAAPASHEGWADESCQTCHAEGSLGQTGTAAATPHEIEGKEACSMCHSGAMEGMPAAPASHEGLKDKNCVMCHAPKA